MNTTRMLSYLLVAALAATAGWFAKSASEHVDPADLLRGDVLARVGDNVIDLEQYRAAMRRFGGLKPGQYRTLEQKRALLDRLIRQSVLVSAALADGLDQDPEVLRVWHQVLADRYVELNLRPRLERIDVSPEEVEAHYAANQRHYVRPERRRAALILRRLPAGAEAEERQGEREKIEQARDAIATLEPGLSHFGTVATEFSHERGSRYVGGVIGWFVNHPGRSYKWDRHIIDALFELDRVGDVSPILELPDGYALVRLVALEPEQQRAYAAVETGVRSQLLHQRQVSEKETFKAEMAARVEIEINERLLAGVAPLSGEAADGDQRPPALPSG